MSARVYYFTLEDGRWISADEFGRIVALSMRGVGEGRRPKRTPGDGPSDATRTTALEAKAVNGADEAPLALDP